MRGTARCVARRQCGVAGAPERRTEGKMRRRRRGIVTRPRVALFLAWGSSGARWRRGMGTCALECSTSHRDAAGRVPGRRR